LDLGLHVLINCDIKLGSNLEEEERRSSLEDGGEGLTDSLSSEDLGEEVSVLVPEVDLEVNGDAIKDLEEDGSSALGEESLWRGGQSEVELHTLVDLHLVLNLVGNFSEGLDEVCELGREDDSNVTLCPSWMMEIMGPMKPRKGARMSFNLAMTSGAEPFLTSKMKLA